MGERKMSLTSNAGTTGNPHTKNDSNPYLMTYTQVNSKCAIDLNVRQKV